MVASSIYIVDSHGKPIISREYRGDINQLSIQKFFRLLNDAENSEDAADFGADAVSPILFDKASETYFFYVKHHNLYFVAASIIDSNAFVIFEFLNKLIEVLREYFGQVEEESVKDNFVLIYELLDEMLDYGYPQMTEDKILKEYIMQEGFRFMENLAASGTQTASTVHSAYGPSSTSVAGGVDERSLAMSGTLSNVVNWRPHGIKYKKNEVYLDVIESLNMLINTNGDVIHAEVFGAIQMKCCLSGMPEVKLGPNEKLLAVTEMSNGAAAAANALLSRSHSQQSVGTAAAAAALAGGDSDAVQDIKFHTCVRLTKFENDRIISFIPPDGEFELMTYRYKPKADLIKPVVNVACSVECFSGTRIKYTLTASVNIPKRRKSGYCSIDILVPVPSDADSPRFRTSVGVAEYVPEKDVMRWRIRQCPSVTNEFTCTANFGLPTLRRDDSDKLPPIQVHFEIPYFTISGSQIKYLKVVEKSGYEASPWVRYITRNGDYQVRMPDIRKPIDVY